MNIAPNTQAAMNDAFIDEPICKLLHVKIAEYIRLWGGPASMTLLDPSCEHFTTTHIPGIIGYKLEIGCAIVFGDPVCHPDDKPALALAFQEYCQKRKLSFIYVAVSETFANWAMQNLCGTLLEIGKELILDPHYDPKQGSIGRVLRRKTNHASSVGVTIHEYTPADVALKPAIEQVGIAWLKARKGPQIYLADVDLCTEDIGKRVLYAKQGDQIVGVLLLNQLDIRQGWLVHLLMITPEAPNGTPELLIIKAIENLRKEGCSYLSFGIAQAEQLGEIIGLNSLSTWIARKLFKLAQRLFSLDGRRIFWQKFQPNSERTFILWDRPGIGLKQIRGLTRALNVSL